MDASMRNSAVLVKSKIPTFLVALERRRSELINSLSSNYDDVTGDAILEAQKNKVNATLIQIFGLHSEEYHNFSCHTLSPVVMVPNPALRTVSARLPLIRKAISAQVINIDAIRDILQEQLEESEEDDTTRTMRAYEGMSLHDEIARACSKLFRDGHYANAVEAAVKSLNGLVRLRSGIEIDGTALMEQAFSPKNPVLRFNEMKDASDRDEQKGYMQLFSGAVSGLRNPRAHGFVNDLPERALEFIAFVSLLAKLLDQAIKGD